MILNSTNLRKYRDIKRLSQEDVAVSLGVSQATISEWEKRDTNVKLEHILNLSKIFDVGIEELLSEPNSIININNQSNNKISSNAVVGFNVHAQIIGLQNELIEQLKKQISILEEQLKKQDSKN